MNTALVKHDLLQSLNDKEFREAFNLENVYTSICFQIRALREQRGKSQKQLGRMIHPMMAQERISILEDPNAETKPTLATLLRVADGFDVGLEVRFVPFSTILKRSVETDMEKLQVESFKEELPSLEAQIESEARAARQEQEEDALVAVLRYSPVGAYIYGSEDTRQILRALGHAATCGQELVQLGSLAGQQEPPTPFPPATVVYKSETADPTSAVLGHIRDEQNKGRGNKVVSITGGKPTPRTAADRATG